MDTVKLELFLDLAQSHSFSATAKKFFRTQPAVSISIRKLEEELGVGLIERGSGTVRLTAEGEILRKQAAEILSQVNDLKFRASVIAKKPEGLVRFAAIHSIGLYELSDTIRYFIKKYREIRLKLHYDEFRKVYERVEDKAVDFGVVAYPQATHDVEVIPLRESEMVVIAPKDKKFGSRKEIRLEELEGMEFVTFASGIPTREAIDAVLKQAKVEVDVRFEDNNIETLKNAVEVGMGISILPFKTVEKESHLGRFTMRHIKGQPLKRPIGIIKLKRRPLSRAAEFFLEALLKSKR